jgi:hypothetical protein
MNERVCTWCVCMHVCVPHCLRPCLSACLAEKARRHESLCVSRRVCERINRHIVYRGSIAQGVHSRGICITRMCNRKRFLGAQTSHPYALAPSHTYAPSTVERSNTQGAVLHSLFTALSLLPAPATRSQYGGILAAGAAGVAALVSSVHVCFTCLSTKLVTQAI